MRVILPSLVFLVGLGLLLTNLNIFPGVDLIWTGGLVVAGLLTLLFSGIDKFSIVVGPFLITAGVLSFLRQKGIIKFEIEAPILMMTLGALWFYAVSAKLPSPKWIKPQPAAK